ncbi:MAG: hypothetical protein WCY27_03325 [archaeon]|nr:hypothetical protein [archaeon]MDD2478072.1 hypothetical protein [Candidatus ainarchaeum sp.]MDD3084944.1 hypothetical protein [Candidatus ainarchaeum sp.]MDD4221503.1 hypothetical protein [Candidatus ainarchaeum sp.]MDD4663021.1 hypothetical protein [Candidatus ainarchaeum sp.]
MEKTLTYIFLFFLIFITGQYDLLILSSVAIGIFFMFSPSWWNILIFIAYFFATVIFELPGNIAILSLIVLFVIMVLFNFINRKKASASGDDSGELDFSKLFGGGA